MLCSNTLYDMQVYSPTDSIMRGNEEGTCVLIDVAILGDRNVVEKGNEKVLKCANLTITKQASRV